MNPLIVNYHDACIYQSDLHLLMNNEWLNDACINFEMTRLSHFKQSKVNCSSTVPLPHIEFLDPSVVSFFMHQLSPGDGDDHDEFRNLYCNWGVSKSCDELVILLVPINDNNSQGFEMFHSGSLGNHWSLLAVFVKGERIQFFHFDSSSGYNRLPAEKVCARLGLINQLGREVTSLSTGNLIECNVPQQKNGYDCGVHTLATAEALSTQWDSFDPKLLINFLSQNHVQQMAEYLEGGVDAYIGSYGSTCEMGRVKRRTMAENIRLEAATANASAK